MRFILMLVVGLIAGSAWATNFSDVDNAKQLIAELVALQSTRDVAASDVLAVTVEAHVKNGPVERQYRFTFKPTDTNWNTMLSGINQGVTGRIATIKTLLQGMGVTGVPN